MRITINLLKNWLQKQNIFWENVLKQQVCNTVLVVKKLGQALHIFSQCFAELSVAFCAVEVHPFLQALIKECFCFFWYIVSFQVHSMYNVDIDGREALRESLKL